MSRGKVVAILAVGLFAASLLTAGAATDKGSLTVGDFAVMIASKVNTEAPNARMTPEQATGLLAKSGVKIKGNLASPLTEEGAAEIFGQFGITLQAGRTNELLDPARAKVLVGLFGDTLASHGAAGNTSLKGVRTSGSSTSGSPSIETTVAECQSLPRPPAPCDAPQSVCNPCMECCKVQLNLTGKTCGTICQKKNLTVSPGEPTP